MPEDYYIKSKQKITQKDIILQQLKEILNISNQEYKESYDKIIIHSNYEERLPMPDNRKCKIQSVEAFADILLGEYDSTFDIFYKKHNEEIDKIEKEFLGDKITENKYISFKLKKIRILFQEIIKLLNRKKFFAKETMGISSGDKKDGSDIEIVDTEDVDE